MLLGWQRQNQFPLEDTGFIQYLPCVFKLLGIPLPLRQIDPVNVSKPGQLVLGLLRLSLCRFRPRLRSLRVSLRCFRIATRLLRV